MRNTPAMTRGHFQLIADVIAELPDTYNDHAMGTLATLRRDLADRFADTLRTTNGNFDRERFIRACKVETTEH